MPPVEFANEKTKKTLRFLRNTAYNGKDYGPGLPDGDTAEVEGRWVIVFLENGRAVEVAAEKNPSLPLGEVQVADPVAEHRDPELPTPPSPKKK
jgi:hypothetical protein